MLKGELDDCPILATNPLEATISTNYRQWTIIVDNRLVNGITLLVDK